MTIRRAAVTEAARLSALALRSKAVWGYDETFLQAAASELEVSAALIADAHVFVEELGGDIVGFCSVHEEEGRCWLRDLFVAPTQMGSGIGRSLWAHAVATARQLGHTTLWLIADPNAEPFYLRMGATRAGEVPSSVQPGRMLPLMQAAV